MTPAELQAFADLAARIDQLTAAVTKLTADQSAHAPLADLQTAADHMGISTRTLRRMVDREEVPYRRVGRALRFNLALLGPRRPAT